MFRKPKAKNIRQRIRDSDDEESTKNSHMNLSNNGDSSSIIEENSEENTLPLAKSKNILSFDQNEDDDVVEFKLKKSSQQHAPTEKSARKHKKMQILSTTKKVSIKSENGKKEDEGDIVIVNETQKVVIKTETSNEIRPEYVQERKFQVPDHPNNSDIPNEMDVRSKFASSFTNIPDAKAVYEARKKRERMRQDGSGRADGEFIPLDDTVRLKTNNGNRSGERSRLVREDDNDMSDEEISIESGGKFYSAKSLLVSEEEKRRSEQINFLRIEQGDSDHDDDEILDGFNQQNSENVEEEEEEDEFARWEREQIRKGVSSQKVNKLQQEMNATSIYYTGRGYDPKHSNANENMDPEEMDMDVEIVETNFTKPNFIQADGSLPSCSSITIEDIMAKIRLKIARKREYLNSAEENLKKMQENLEENRVSIELIDKNELNLQKKFQLFQEIRPFVRDLLECLNEKIEGINSLEEQIMSMWAKRTERLIKRHRQDVQDEYERCSAASSKRQWTYPTEDYQLREAEREARRSRRRRAREKSQGDNIIVNYYKGLSSDDEETTSQEMVYRDTIVSVLEKSAQIFVDTADDYCDIGIILHRFIDWILADSKSYDEAYVELCIPKLLAPFIRLEMLNWRPLENNCPPLTSFNWYRKILLLGTDNTELDFETPAVANIIPLIVEKVVLAKIGKIIQDQWNPISLTESRNLGKVLREIVEEYPTATAKSPQIKLILKGIYDKAKASIEADLFIPLYSKEAIESPETGCAAFLERQFWKSIKLIRSICSFRNFLSDSCLEELIIEGIINRYVVLSLQFSLYSDSNIIQKCLALVEEIPQNWIPSKKSASYGPMVGILRQVVELYRFKYRDFCKQIQKFVDMASDTSKRRIKNEIIELDENEDE